MLNLKASQIFILALFLVFVFFYFISPNNNRHLSLVADVFNNSKSIGEFSILNGSSKNPITIKSLVFNFEGLSKGDYLENISISDFNNLNFIEVLDNGNVRYELDKYIVINPKEKLDFDFYIDVSDIKEELLGNNIKIVSVNYNFLSSSEAFNIPNLVVFKVPKKILSINDSNNIKTFMASTRSKLPNDSINTSIKELADLNDEYNQNNKGFSPLSLENKTKDILKNMISKAKERQSLLKELAYTNPEKVLEYAVTEEERKQYPSAVQNELEKNVNKEGILETLHFDDFENKTSIYEYFIFNKASKEKINVFFTNSENALPSAGAKVSLRGLEIPNQAIIIDNKNTSDVKILSHKEFPKVNKIRTLIIPVNFPGSDQRPFTKEQINEALFGDNFTLSDGFGHVISSKEFYRKNSQGRLELEGDILDWQFVNFNSSRAKCVSHEEAASFDEKVINTLISKRVSLDNYTNVSIFINKICDVWGWGTVGPVFTPSINKEISLNVGMLDFGIVQAVATFNHELGHNLGLYHASSCEKSSIYTLNNGIKRLACQTLEYGDTFDIMGGAFQNYFFNLPHKWKLGWIDKEKIIQIDFKDILEDKVFTINSIDEKTSNPVGIAVNLEPTFPISSNERYLIEYRLDKELGLNNKILIHRDYIKDITNLLPSSPSILINASNARFPMDFDLDIGESWEDLAVGIKFTVLNKTHNTATIKISRISVENFFKIEKENIKSPLTMESGEKLSIPIKTNIDLNNIVIKIISEELRSFIDLDSSDFTMRNGNIIYEDVNNLLPGNYEVYFIHRQSDGSTAVLDSIDLIIEKPTLKISGKILGDIVILPITINNSEPFYSDFDNTFSINSKKYGIQPGGKYALKVLPIEGWEVKALIPVDTPGWSKERCGADTDVPEGMCVLGASYTHQVLGKACMGNIRDEECIDSESFIKDMPNDSNFTFIIKRKEESYGAPEPSEGTVSPL